MTAISDELDPLIRGLLRPDAYDHPTREFAVLETHISWVILTGDFAYKLKKPVNFGFVDFTTREKRRFYCEEEMRLNRRQTRELYLAVKPLYGPRERATFQGAGEPIDYAVQMRQFSQADLLPNVLARGKMRPELLECLAGNVAEVQRLAPIAALSTDFGSPAGIRQNMDANFTALDLDPRQTDAVRQLRNWAGQEFVRCESEFLLRKSAGNIREGHGDMHLGNMILRHNEIEVFDCLEFNAGLRWIDVISEVAFLVMDLSVRGRPDLGWRFLNEWLMQSGDYTGLKTWAWYYVYRALVRAKVAVLRKQQADVADEKARFIDRQITGYVQQALSVVHRPPPKLVLTHGVSGSGKSHWARRTAAARGLVWVRSDVERKRLFSQQSAGQTPLGELYSSTMTAHTYAHLRAIAETVLRSGWSVIIDATFLLRSQRQPFRELARSLDIDCRLVSFDVAPDTLRRRIIERQQAGHDPSDATLEVLAGQLDRAEAVQADEDWTVISVDAAGSSDNSTGW